MPGQIVHVEIPADNTAEGQRFGGSLFGWKFEAYPGPSQYHMTQISDRTGVAVANTEPGKRGMRISTLTTSMPAPHPSWSSAAR